MAHLFRLDRDPHESEDLAAAEPERFEAMRQRLRSFPRPPTIAPDVTPPPGPRRGRPGAGRLLTLAAKVPEGRLDAAVERSMAGRKPRSHLGSKRLAGNLGTICNRTVGSKARASGGPESRPAHRRTATGCHLRTRGLLGLSQSTIRSKQGTDPWPPEKLSAMLKEGGAWRCRSHAVIYSNHEVMGSNCPVWPPATDPDRVRAIPCAENPPMSPQGSSTKGGRRALDT